jgi:hypothetical protein
MTNTSTRKRRIDEGEAKADLAWSWNLAGTYCACGSEKWKPEHIEFLRGANVAGLKMAAQTRRAASWPSVATAPRGHGGKKLVEEKA